MAPDAPPPVPAVDLRNAESILRAHIHQTYRNQGQPQGWKDLTEIPSTEEIRPTVYNLQRDDSSENWDEYQFDPVYSNTLPTNVIDGAWGSKDEYLGAHYQILREDATASLRKAVAKVQRHPSMLEDESICIYDDVRVVGLQLSRGGAALRVSFNLGRSGKLVRWEQSKRLLQGTVIALTTRSDPFTRVCKIATVAARPIEGGLDRNPPTVDLFLGDGNDVWLDPVTPYIMVEARDGYYEAYRSMLTSMQKLATEKFPLANKIVHLDTETNNIARYVEECPYFNLSSLEDQDPTLDIKVTDNETLSHVDILKDFPAEVTESGMDASQLLATQSMLAQKLAIVQGPPGTGKTYVSVAVLKVMIENMLPSDPPIVVAAQTNHALDQLLTHILKFEPDILRLGGRCDRGNEEIVGRTLYNLRKKGSHIPGSNHGLRGCAQAHAGISSQIQAVLHPLTRGDLYDAKSLLDNRIITQAQYDSLFTSDWGEEITAEDGDTQGWLGDNLMPIIGTAPLNLGLPMEDMDIEFEQLRELEQELNGDMDSPEEEFALNGVWVPFGRKYTGNHPGIVSNHRAEKFLERLDDLYKIPPAQRGHVYRYFEKRMDALMLSEIKSILQKYEKHVRDYQVTKNVLNYKLIRNLDIKVIGCTTTGLSKYRALLAAVSPRTLLVEEAAETLEGKIIGGMVESLEQLILVGDHRQLQASCTVQALERAPYYMNVSMFERLVMNNAPYIMLNRQRRMITEIRQLLTIPESPFYESLQDHPLVLDRKFNRPPVPGMGGRDCYFFHHDWPEATGGDFSRYNPDEAEFVTNFYVYLYHNGVIPSSITVLTFYNGQRKALLRALRNHPDLKRVTYFKVFTIDSYQGEENDIILLSLVRSNMHLGVGFLDSKNRLVVALSRARRGLYIFGNSLTLIGGEQGIGRDLLWEPLVVFMGQRNQLNVDRGLPIVCSQHNAETWISTTDDWVGIVGGCQKDCRGRLPCGHPCTYKCHVFAHDLICCKTACPKTLDCGHGCSRYCGEECHCDACNFVVDDPQGNRHQVEVIDGTELQGGNGANRSSFRGPPAMLSALESIPVRPRFERRLGARPGSQPDHESALAQEAITGIPIAQKKGVEQKVMKVSRTNTPKRMTNFFGLHRESPGAPTLDRVSPIQPNGTISPFDSLQRVSSPQQWQNWDAKKADLELAEQMKSQQNPNSKGATPAIQETYNPTFVTNGVRSRGLAGPVHSQIKVENGKTIRIVTGKVAGSMPRNGNRRQAGASSSQMAPAPLQNTSNETVARSSRTNIMSPSLQGRGPLHNRNTRFSEESAKLARTTNHPQEVHDSSSQERTQVTTTTVVANQEPALLAPGSYDLLGLGGDVEEEKTVADYSDDLISFD